MKPQAIVVIDADPARVETAAYPLTLLAAAETSLRYSFSVPPPPPGQPARSAAEVFAAMAAGPMVHCLVPEGVTPLMNALDNLQWEVASYLLDAGETAAVERLRLLGVRVSALSKKSSLPDDRLPPHLQLRGGSREAGCG